MKPQNNNNIIFLICILKVERLQNSDKTGHPNVSSVNGCLSDIPDHHHHLDERIRQERKMERENRQNIVLWRKPLLTMQYFMLELIITIQEYWKRYKERMRVKTV